MAAGTAEVLPLFSGEIEATEIYMPAIADQANDATQALHRWMRAAASGVAIQTRRPKLFRKDQSSRTNAEFRAQEWTEGSSYEAVYSTLAAMAALPEGDELAITAEAEQDARSFIMLLALYGVPAPKLMSHSGDTVVLGWRKDGLQQYLTLEEGCATLLRVLSAPRRKMSCELDRSNDEQMLGLIKILERFPPTPDRNRRRRSSWRTRLA